MVRCRCGAYPTEIFINDDDKVLGCPDCVSTKVVSEGVCGSCRAKITDLTRVFVKNDEILGCEYCAHKTARFPNTTIWDRETDDEFFKE